MTNSRVLAKLRSGGFVRAAAVSRLTDPWLTEVIGRIGYDLVWLDMEHRPMPFSVLDPISLACRATGMDLMVRVRKSGSDSMRALECGANGIMAPHCKSAEEARQWVEWTRFPPLGKRGLDGAGADGDYGLADTRAYLEHANRETFLAVQIEDREAVESVEQIASVEGVDLLFIGPGDLSLSYGVPLEFDHPHLLKATERIASAANRAGKWWGTVTSTAHDAQKVLGQGARMVVPAGDHNVLLDGFRNRFDEFRSIQQGT